MAFKKKEEEDQEQGTLVQNKKEVPAPESTDVPSESSEPPPSEPPPAEPKAKQEPRKDKHGRTLLESKSDAVKLFNKNYKMPKGENVAYVTEDGQVFFKQSEGSAHAHAKQNGLKIFTINN